MKKLVIFHICALSQLYVKQNQSYLRLDPPPWKNFLDPRLALTSALSDNMYLRKRYHHVSNEVPDLKTIFYTELRLNVCSNLHRNVRYNI